MYRENEEQRVRASLSPLSSAISSLVSVYSVAEHGVRECDATWASLSGRHTGGGCGHAGQGPAAACCKRYHCATAVNNSLSALHEERDAMHRRELETKGERRAKLKTRKRQEEERQNGKRIEKGEAADAVEMKENFKVRIFSFFLCLVSKPLVISLNLLLLSLLWTRCACCTRILRVTLLSCISVGGSCH